MMQSISGADSLRTQLSVSRASAEEAQKTRQPGEEAQGLPQKPVMDEYIPEEKQEPSGRYWMGKDEDGRPKIYFSDPDADQKAEGPDKKGTEPEQKADGPDKKDSAKKAESCTCNTDKADREIEKLKKKKEELEQQLRTETDETKIKDLEGELAQVERELRQKDNDTYRRQHATYTFS